MSGHYTICNHCGNTDNEDSIFRCDECNFFFCMSCSQYGPSKEDPYGDDHILCPNCDSNNYTTVGEIYNPDEDVEETINHVVSNESIPNNEPKVNNEIITFELELYGKDSYDLMKILKNSNEPVLKKITALSKYGKKLDNYDLKSIFSSSSQDEKVRIEALKHYKDNSAFDYLTILRSNNYSDQIKLVAFDVWPEKYKDDYDTASLINSNICEELLLKIVKYKCEKHRKSYCFDKVENILKDSKFDESTRYKVLKIIESN